MSWSRLFLETGPCTAFYLLCHWGTHNASYYVIAHFFGSGGSKVYVKSNNAHKILGLGSCLCLSNSNYTICRFLLIQCLEFDELWCQLILEHNFVRNILIGSCTTLQLSFIYKSTLLSQNFVSRHIQTKLASHIRRYHLSNIVIRIFALFKAS